MNFHLGGPDPQMGVPGPQYVRALYGHPKGAHNGERKVPISAAVTEKIAFEKKPLVPPSGETESGWGPISRMIVGVDKAYIVLKFHRSQAPRSVARRLRRNLEMPYYENALFPIRAQWAKILTTESEKNSSTLSVIGVVRRRRRKQFRHPKMRNYCQHVVSNQTGSGIRSDIAAIDSSTTCSYSTSIGYRGLSATITKLENYFRFVETGSTNIRRRPTFQTSLKQSPSD